MVFWCSWRIIRGIIGAGTNTTRKGKPDIDVQPENINQEIQQPKEITIQKPLSRNSQFLKDGLNSMDPIINMQTQKINSDQIIESAKLNKVSENEVNEIIDISNKLQVPIRFVDSLEYGAEGKYEDGTIYISKETKNPAQTVYIHELTHHIQNSDYYGSMQNELIKLANMDNFDTEQLRTMISESYAKKAPNLQLDTQKMESEVTAVLAQKYLFNEDSIKKLVADDRNLAHKILDWIKGALSKSRGKSAYSTQLKNVENIYKNALYAPQNKVDLGDTQYSINVSLEEAVDRALKDKTNKYSSVFLRDTPEVLTNTGIHQNPMLITQKHLKTVILESGNDKGNYHALGKELFLQVPKAMENPLIVAKSKGNRVLMVLDLYDSNNQPILVAIQPDGKSKYNKVMIDSNHILSVYGKNNIGAFVKNLYEKNQIVFPKNVKKEQLEDLIPRLQLPNDRSSDVPTTSIYNKNDFDNNNLSMGIDINDPVLKKSNNLSKAQKAEKRINTFVADH